MTKEMRAFRKEERQLRETYVDLLIEKAREDENICVLEADLMRAVGNGRFQAQYPERTYDVGIQEANMIGVAAGMSAMGKIPFAHTFTPFMTRRVCDQITVSVSYAGLNVKLVGSDPGITAEFNGGTHMSIEDVSIMRNIPGMVIFEPADSTQLRKIFPQILNHPGPVYLRLLRKTAEKIFEEPCEFTLGKGHLLQEGADISIFCTGIMTAESLKAADMLKEEGISAEVINIHTVKPLDAEMVLQSVKKTGCALTAENHSVIGGLGSAVSELLSEEEPAPMCRIGIKDRFGEVGTTEYLKRVMGLRADDIAEAARRVIKKKGRVR